MSSKMLETAFITRDHFIAGYIYIENGMQGAMDVAGHHHQEYPLFSATVLHIHCDFHLIDEASKIRDDYHTAQPSNETK